jgi:hypothetical protein
LSNITNVEVDDGRPDKSRMGVERRLFEKVKLELEVRVDALSKYATRPAAPPPPMSPSDEVPVHVGNPPETAST